MLSHFRDDIFGRISGTTFLGAFPGRHFWAHFRDDIFGRIFGMTGIALIRS
jgi:hypothetical protein